MGRDAVRLVRKAGWSLNPWQEFLLEESLAQDAAGLYTASDVGVVVSRQNGKGQVIIARQLVGLFMLDEPLQIYTSHLFTTTLEMHRRLKDAVYGYPPFAKRVLKSPGGGNDVGVELRSGQRVRFLARSASSGRGFSTDATLYLDEAMNLTDPEIEALVPTSTTARNLQVWYAGSAGLGEPSRVFARVRRRGLANEGGLLWAEWSVSENADPNDEALWGMANPGLGHGQVSLRNLRRFRDSMSGEGYAREFLGVGDWPDDDTEQSGITVARWNALADPGAPDPQTLRPVVFSFDVSHDRSRAAIGVAGRRPDGMSQVEVADHANGTAWVVPRLVELKARYNPAAIVLDTGSPAASLLPELQQAGIEPALLGTPDVKQACGGFYDAVMGETPTLRHPGTAALSNALQGASRRDLGDAWAWSRKHSTSDICPLVAVTNALHGLSVYGSKSYDLMRSFW